jgi:membrane associated rhomboid family serine protease
MIVMPVKDGLQWKFPVVTLCLVLLNCLVFSGFQHNEDEGYKDAWAFAQASGLLRIESVVYKDFLKTNQRKLPAEFQDNQKSEAFFWYMMRDDKFQQQLADHALITPSDPGYAHWLELRHIMEADLERVFSRNWGYSPARHNYAALFTSMFLHQNFWHLLVNIILLWFVGALLEIGIGPFYVVGYVLAGFFGSLLYGLIFPIAQGPLVGATGAIAGLMGIYAVVYSSAKLRAIHTFQFPLDYTGLPGWLFLPFWLVSEIVQIVLGTGADNVYVSHIGGLLVGLGLGMVYLKKPEVVPHVVEKKTVKKIDELKEKLQDELAVRRYGSAREIVLQMLKLEPENTEILTYLFNIDKNAPASEEFQATAGLFLGHLAKRKGSYDIEKYFEEYVVLCPSSTVHPDVLLAVATSYIHSGKTEPAAKYLAVLLKVAPDNGGLPACLFNLAQMYRAGDHQEQAKKCLRILCSHYPDTNSGRKAKELLSPQLNHTFNTDDNTDSTDINPATKY